MPLLSVSAGAATLNGGGKPPRLHRSEPNTAASAVLGASAVKWDHMPTINAGLRVHPSGTTFQPTGTLLRPVSSFPATRPGSPETCPGSPETRPGSPETRPGSPETRPGSPETRPGSPEIRPGSPETCPGSPAVRPNGTVHPSPRCQPWVSRPPESPRPNGTPHLRHHQHPFHPPPPPGISDKFPSPSHPPLDTFRGVGAAKNPRPQSMTPPVTRT